MLASVHTLPAVSEQCSLAGDSQMMRSMQKKQKGHRGKRAQKMIRKKQQVDNKANKALKNQDQDNIVILCWDKYQQFI